MATRYELMRMIGQKPERTDYGKAREISASIMAAHNPLLSLVGGEFTDTSAAVLHEERVRASLQKGVTYLIQGLKDSKRSQYYGSYAEVRRVVSPYQNIPSILMHDLKHVAISRKHGHDAPAFLREVEGETDQERSQREHIEEVEVGLLKMESLISFSDILDKMPDWTHEPKK